MELHVAPERLISEIQKDFNSAFPFLKIEFFNNKSFSRSEFSVKQIIPHNRKLGDSNHSLKDGIIEIEEDMKVNELEKLMTDNWTLLQQNNHGREITNGKDKELPPDDYDMNRDAFS